MERFKWLVLFTSSTCLLCCALPIFLVSLGLGSVMASLVSSVPIIITISIYKVWTFSISAVLLIVTGWLLYRPGRTCPIDPELAKQCKIADKWNRRFFIASVVIWTIGFITAYALPYILGI